MQSTGCCSTKKKTVNNCQRSAQLNWMDFRFALMCLSYIFFSLMFRCCLGYFMHNKPACSIVLFLDLEKSRAQALRWTEYIYEESWSELITIVKSQITQSARRRRRTMTTTEVQHVFKGSGMELWGELLLLQLTFQCLHFSVCFSVLVCRRALASVFSSSSSHFRLQPERYAHLIALLLDIRFAARSNHQSQRQSSVSWQLCASFSVTEEHKNRQRTVATWAEKCSKWKFSALLRPIKWN